MCRLESLQVENLHTRSFHSSSLPLIGLISIGKNFASIAGLSFPCLIINDIYGEIIPERLYGIAQYWLIFLATSLFTFLNTTIFTYIGENVAKKNGYQLA